MRVRILGSAAGGGVPQWNCGCANCQAARDGLPHVRPRTQSSVAISADGQWWYLLNVSADVRQQLARYDDLGPWPGTARGTPIAGCILTDAELDHTSGLMQLREGAEFAIWSSTLVRRWLNEFFPIEPLMTFFSRPTWLDLPLGIPLHLELPGGKSAGIVVKAFETGRGVPRFVLGEAAAAVGSLIGLEIVDPATGGKLVYAPGVPAITEKLVNTTAGAGLLLLDGSFWTNDEPRKFGITERTSQQMGHVPVTGPQGSLEWLAKLPVPQRVYVHINNTNPMLDENGAEYAQVREYGVRVSADADEFEI